MGRRADFLAGPRSASRASASSGGDVGAARL
jgi:hypothetical protein